MYYAGIDLGGTNIAAGIVSENGKIIKSMSIPTNAGRDFREIVRDMAELVKKLADNANIPISDINAVGIGCPGSIDSERGVCEYA
ncbi:MAG: ROK family protein, partial [Clostridia bacterium]|nr:ROK family protein [Clostridia bacterium]